MPFTLSNNVSTFTIERTINLTNFHQVIKASPAIQILLDTGNSTITDVKDIYHAVMGMCLALLSKREPTKYTLSNALSHHAHTISGLRHRISQKIFNQTTYINILCAMQTEVRLADILALFLLLLQKQAILGNEKAMAAHKAGLDVVAQMMTGC